MPHPSSRSLQKHVNKIRSILFSTIVVFVAYVGLGALFYWYAEGWDYDDCVYFAVVSISTVGYGDLILTQWYSKLFNAAYILFGGAIVFARFSELLTSLEAAAVTRAWAMPLSFSFSLSERGRTIENAGRASDI